jgi:integrase
MNTELIKAVEKVIDEHFERFRVQIESKWFERSPQENKTLMELAVKYETGAFKETKSYQSVQSYLNGLKEFFGPYTLSEITPALIDEFKQRRKADGVKPATINRQLTIFRRMFNLAKKRWMWIKEIPVIEMEAKADHKRVRHLSFEEYHKLIAYCDGYLKPIVIVGAWTGLRQGNILNLKREQINLFERTITLDGKETKNNEYLKIPIATPALEALKEAMRIPHINSPYVFCSRDGSLYKKWNIQKRLKKALKVAGIDDFRFHDLRHCFASWNRQAGVDINTIADLLGHKDAKMASRYAHIAPVHLKKAVESLERSYQEFIIGMEKGLIKAVNT